MWLRFKKDYKYLSRTYFKKDSLEFVPNDEFAQYLIDSGYAVKK